MTVKAVALGLFLALVFGSANAYLGMRAGQTVSATLPAAIIALALFRIPGFRGTLLEQNIARTAASVGEALVAGAIFTIPAFAMVGYWKDLRSHYWEATAILVCGGLIGVLFIVLLRRPLCVEADLPWPESVAAANIVRAGGESSEAPKYINTRSPPSSRAAELRSWLCARWPSSRACWRRCCVGSCDLSPASSAMKSR